MLLRQKLSTTVPETQSKQEKQPKAHGGKRTIDRPHNRIPIRKLLYELTHEVPAPCKANRRTEKAAGVADEECGRDAHA
eukprot:CCRYP_003116-RA/>CCRYP_003116-RA protein AED:0.07 eAED:0.08 QI:0/0/0.5/1/0/0/2/2030/78